MNKSRVTIALGAMYAFGIFVTSDQTLRIMSMTLCNFISIAMLLILIFQYAAGKRDAARDPLAVPLMIAIVWACLSLLLSYFNPDTAASSDANLYAWAVGVSSPGLRGVSYLFRFILSVSAFHFLFTALNSSQRYFFVLKVFSWGYLLFCTITLIQIIAYHYFGYSFGEVFVDSIGRVRIGSYVGEPSVMSALMLSGFFLFSPFLKLPTGWRVVHPYLRWYGFIAASISLFYAMSAAIIAAIVLVFAYSRVKYARGLFLAMAISSIVLFLPSAGERLYSNSVVNKIRAELTTINIRSFSWIVGYRMLMASPLTGVGIGRTPFLVEKYIPTDVEIPFDIYSDFNYAEMRHTTMNSYLEWVDETGLIGGIILIWIIRMVYRYQKIYADAGTGLVRNAFGTALLALVIASNSFPGAFYLPHFGFLLAFYLAGLRIFSGQSASCNTPLV